MISKIWTGTVCTNLSNASSLVLRTDVLLDNGYVHIALENVSGDFEIWLPEWYDNQSTWHGPEKLLDGTSKTERYISMSKWRSIMRRYYETQELAVNVLSSSEGSCTLKFEFAASDGTRYVHDFTEQKISSVDTVTGSYVGNEHVEHRQRMSPENAANLTDEQLRQHPFFLDFYNPEMHTSSNGLIVATNYLYHAEMLAYAIPSESYAVGANPLPGRTSMLTYNPDGDLYCNHDMAILFTSGQSDLPQNGEDMDDKHQDWQHSTFVQRSYKRVHQLYKVIIHHIKEYGNE